MKFTPIRNSGNVLGKKHSSHIRQCLAHPEFLFSISIFLILSSISFALIIPIMSAPQIIINEPQIVNYTEWGVEKKTGNEVFFDVHFNNSKEKKTDICFFIMDGVNPDLIDKSDKYLYDENGSIITDAKGKAIRLKFEKEKCDIKGIKKDSYFISLSDPDIKDKIDKYIKFGSSSIMIEYKERKMVAYFDDLMNLSLNTTLRSYINGSWTNNISELYVYTKEYGYKYSAIDNSSAETQTKYYNYLYEFNQPLFSKYLWEYYFVDGKGDRVSFNLEDICADKYINITNDYFMPNCTLLFFNNSMQVAFYSLKYIDPPLIIQYQDNQSAHFNITSKPSATMLNLSNNSIMLYMDFEINGTRTYDLSKNTVVFAHSLSRQDIEGKYGHSYNFTGVAPSYLQGQTFPVPDTWTNSTYSAWVNIPSINALQRMEILGKTSSGGGVELQFYIDTTGHACILTTSTSVCSLSAIATKTWVMVTATISNKTLGNQSIYINGVLDNSAIKTSTLSTSTYQWFIGAARTNSLFFNGSIDELLVMNHTLMPDEVMNLYNGQFRKFYQNGEKYINNLNFSRQVGRVVMNLSYFVPQGGNLSFIDGYSNGTNYTYNGTMQFLDSIREANETVEIFPKGDTQNMSLIFYLNASGYGYLTPHIKGNITLTEDVCDRGDYITTCWINHVQNLVKHESYNMNNLVIENGGQFKSNNTYNLILNLSGNMSIENGGMINLSGSSCYNLNCKNGGNLTIISDILNLSNGGSILADGGNFHTQTLDKYTGRGGVVNITSNEFKCSGNISLNGGNTTANRGSGNDAGKFYLDVESNFLLNCNIIAIGGQGDNYGRAGFSGNGGLFYFNESSYNLTINATAWFPPAERSYQSLADIQWENSTLIAQNIYVMPNGDMAIQAYVNTSALTVEGSFGGKCSPYLGGGIYQPNAGNLEIHSQLFNLTNIGIINSTGGGQVVTVANQYIGKGGMFNLTSSIIIINGTISLIGGRTPANVQRGGGGDGGILILNTNSSVIINGDINLTGGTAGYECSGNAKRGKGGQFYFDNPRWNLTVNREIDTNMGLQSPCNNDYYWNDSYIDASNIFINTTGIVKMHGEVNTSTLTILGLFGSKANTPVSYQGIPAGNITIKAQLINLTSTGILSAEGSNMATLVTGWRGGAGGVLNISANNLVSEGQISFGGGNHSGSTGATLGGDAGTLILNISNNIVLNKVFGRGGTGDADDLSGTYRRGYGGVIFFNKSQYNITFNDDVNLNYGAEGGVDGLWGYSEIYANTIRVTNTSYVQVNGLFNSSNFIVEGDFGGSADNSFYALQENDAGNVTIITNFLNLSYGAMINSTGGRIIGAYATTGGDGGLINISADIFLLDGKIAFSGGDHRGSSGTGSGGHAGSLYIDIDSNLIINGNITGIGGTACSATAGYQRGNGGLIFIDEPYYNITFNSFIDLNYGIIGIANASWKDSYVHANTINVSDNADVRMAGYVNSSYMLVQGTFGARGDNNLYGLQSNHGGNLTINATTINLTDTGSFYSIGGATTLSGGTNGGSGGNFYFNADAFYVDGTIDVRGGNHLGTTQSGEGGNGGSVYIYTSSDITVNGNITGIGGTGDSDGTTGFRGNGGLLNIFAPVNNVSIYKDLQFGIGTIGYMNGSGGYINITANDLFINSTLNTSGNNSKLNGSVALWFSNSINLTSAVIPTLPLLTRNTSWGGISFQKVMSNYSNKDIDDDMNITFNLAGVNSELSNEINLSANIWLYEIIWKSTSYLARNKALCTDDICTNLSDTGTEIYFNVTHFTNYSVSDWFPPNVTLVYPSNNSILGVDYANFSWYTIDNTDNMLCNITINGTVNQTNIASASGAVTNFTVHDFNDGFYEWNVTCMDSYRNYNTTDTRNFTIDTTAPTIIVNYPVEDGFYDDFNGSINIELNEDGINCSVQSPFWAFESNFSNFFNFINYSTLYEANYGMNISCWDRVYNNGSIIHYFVYDTNSPTIAIITPANNSIFGTDDVLFNWTTSDAVDLWMLCNISINNTVNVSNIDAFHNANTTYTINDFNEGFYNWNITCWDNTTHTNTSLSRNFTVDTVIPTISFVEPTTNATNLSQSHIDANISVVDMFLDYIFIYLFNTTGAVNTTNSTSTPFHSNFTNLQDGYYYLNATANDTFGHYNTTDTRTILLDTHAPTINLTLPSNGLDQSSKTVRFNFTTEDNFFHSLWCNISINETSYRINATNGSFFLFNATLNYGFYHWNVSCNDSLNINYSENRNFSITEPPSGGVVEEGEEESFPFPYYDEDNVTNQTFVLVTQNVTQISNLMNILRKFDLIVQNPYLFFEAIRYTLRNPQEIFFKIKSLFEAPSGIIKEIETLFMNPYDTIYKFRSLTIIQKCFIISIFIIFLAILIFLFLLFKRRKKEKKKHETKQLDIFNA